MLTALISKFFKYARYFGKDFFYNAFGVVFTGVVWFGIESSFVFIFQGFLISINLMDVKQGFLPAWYPQGIFSTTIIFFVYSIFRSYFSAQKTYLSALIQQKLVFKLRKKIFEKSITHSEYIDSARAISIFSEPVSQSGTVAQYVSLMVISVVSTLLLFVVGMRLAFWEMLIGVSALVFLFIPLLYFSKRVSQMGKSANAEWYAVTAGLQSAFKNQLLIKMYNLESNTKADLNSRLYNYFKKYLNFLYLSSIFAATPIFIGLCLIGFISYLSIKYFHTPSIQLVSFFYIFVRMSQGASESYSIYSLIKFNLSGFQIIIDFLETPYQSNKSPLVYSNSHGPVAIKISDLSFAYEQKTIIKNVSAHLSKGDIFLVKGPSGSGKSTLLKLIMGILIPQTGSVELCGFSGENDFREQIGYVGPEANLITGTIRENLLYGLDEKRSKAVNDDSCFRALKMSHLSDFVKDLKGGLDEFVLETAQFSSGQKQRLALARALLRNPKILILDEATANIDIGTEKDIASILQANKNDKIIIIISHRDTFDEIANKKLLINV